MATRYIPSRFADRCSRMKVSANQLEMAMKQLCSVILLKITNDARECRQLKLEGIYVFLVHCQDISTHLVKLASSRVNPRSHFGMQRSVKVCFRLKIQFSSQNGKRTEEECCLF